MMKTTESILLSAEQTLETMKFGLDDYLGKNPKRRETGLRNMIVFGRAVTNVIQNLRSTVGKDIFSEWYVPWQQRMKEDKVMKAFYKMRTEILKEGKLDTLVSVKILELNPYHYQELFKNPPTNAQSFFIGDQLGGSGWIIPLPDGSEEKYYIEFPDEWGIEVSLELKNLPNVSEPDMGEKYQNTQDMALYYYQFLGALVNNAKVTFLY